jgi:propanol-preferring alcohol dehydrogenase
MAELPKQYKACVYDSPGSVSTKVEMLDMPEPSTGEVLINLYAKSSTHAYIYFSM